MAPITTYLSVSYGLHEVEYWCDGQDHFILHDDAWQSEAIIEHDGRCDCLFRALVDLRDHIQNIKLGSVIDHNGNVFCGKIVLTDAAQRLFANCDLVLGRVTCLCLEYDVQEPTFQRFLLDHHELEICANLRLVSRDGHSTIYVHDYRIDVVEHC